MDLILERNEQNCSLYAKLVELTPEEEELLRKTDTTKAYLWEPEKEELYRLGKNYRLGGIAIAILLGLLVSVAAQNMFLFWLIAPLGAIVIPKILAGQYRPAISVSDLLQGRTIRCKNMDEMVVKEAAIVNKLPEYRDYLNRLRTPPEGRKIHIESEY
jgi:hypothetical protein